MDNATLSLSPSTLKIDGCATIRDSSILINHEQNQTIISVLSGCLSINNSHVEVLDDPTCVPDLEYAHSTLSVSLSIASCQHGAQNMGNVIEIVLGVFGSIFVLVLVGVVWKIVQQQKNTREQVK